MVSKSRTAYQSSESGEKLSDWGKLFHNKMKVFDRNGSLYSQIEYGYNIITS